jgi:hypothetical protein
VDEAVGIIRDQNVAWGGGLALRYLIADASGRAALVEFHAGQLIVIPNETPFHLATNHLRVTASADGGCRRCARLDETRGRLAPQEAVDFLENVAQENTQWSIVYGFGDGDVRVAMGHEYDTVHSFPLNLVDRSNQ